mmetsp:Transcript_40695/g.73342  ORF Transcript_40695/g.73342 Transcript_40695/m.73342 type:complete len:569 (-) Transcript_40695:55-1761(-)|eukprot:CAMPEP_0197632172 /NCGR_PEP_ID=MMETSP1338-20131121/9047_1 /TAXON_ID=43686 ORGANISM="Pelagodinium beii, Strain RCC1491" /NCGR_SAMPLE_ID=MMETSP1338 /ASSEMBLY_ACC=CAM_ASM_000754 /LENGTH=568 /DNA_ID=CAMNT_0043203723 /DNA_START=76 /DNA_END=1782 /DNA_ORIENTATION=+
MSTSASSGRRELREGLVAEEEVPASFLKDEIKTMCTVGWPMLVSFFCRFGMASEDSAFVGHLNTKTLVALSQSALGSRLAGQVGAALVAYGFLANSDLGAGEGYGPKEYLAAAGLSDMVTNILIIPPLAFNMSLNALVSQAMGSGNKKMAGTWLQLSLITLTASYLPVLISFFFVKPMLQLLGFDEAICDLAGLYAKFNVFWPIPNGWYQCMRFYFQAQGITRPAMYNNMIFLMVNAFLNWLLVFGGPFRSMGWHGFGFVGAAISLSCSRSMQPLFYWLYMFVYRKAHIDTWPSWSEATFTNREHVKSFMDMALPQIGTLIFQAVVGQATTLLIAKLGEVAISASAASSAATMVLTGGLSPTLSMVGGMRVGFYLGKGEPLRAAKVANLALGLGASLTGVLGIIALILANPIMAIVTNDPEVQKPAISILPAVMLNLVASIVVSIATQGILTSQGRTKIVTFLSMGFELPLSVGSTAILVFVFKANLQTVYWAQAVVSILEAVVIMAILSRSDWPKFAREARQRQGGQDDEEASPEEGQGPDAHQASEISLQDSANNKQVSPAGGESK